MTDEQQYFLHDTEWFNKQTNGHPLIGFFPTKGLFYCEVNRITGTGSTIQEALSECRRRVESGKYPL